MEKIFINSVDINGYNVLDLFGKSILIQIESGSGLQTFSQNDTIQYYIDKNINAKIYFIDVDNLNTIQLKTENFFFNLPNSLNFVYGWYKNEATKSIIV